MSSVCVYEVKIPGGMNTPSKLVSVQYRDSIIEIMVQIPPHGV